jgi:glutathione S-transferase
MAAPQRIVYWGSGSGPAWRVLIALKEKQLEFEARLIEFSKKEHKSEEVLALNPRGQVPTFKDGDVVVNESLAAIIYLEETYANQGTPLLPPLDKPDARALVWQRVAEGGPLADKCSAPFRMQMMANREGKPLDDEAFAAKLEELRVELGYWEGYLQNTQYLAGSSFTLADVYSAPTLLSIQRYGAEFKSFPKIAQYVAFIAERPSISFSAPPHWKDSPRMTAYAAV